MSAKKSFKNSPAMQFLSISETPAPAIEETNSEVLPQTQEENVIPPVSQTKQEHEKAVLVQTPAVKKPAQTKHKNRGEIKNNIVAAQETTTIPMKRNPEYIETRSKRVQLLMQPSLHNTLRKLSQKQEISVNDLIHQVMEAHVQKNR